MTTLTVQNSAYLSTQIDTNSSRTEIQVQTVKKLMDNYDKYWNSLFLKYEGIPYNEEEFCFLAERTIDNFKAKNLPEKSKGYIEKKDLSAGKQIFVRADLHGDLRSLTENIKSLQKNGFLDENFKCKQNLELVFLGDYVDRGDHSLEVLSLILCLKIENPNQVTIIRGNHEEISINMYYCSGTDDNFRSFLDKFSNDLLNKLYETFPLTLYISEVGNNREYIQFTHGLFPLYVVPTELIEANEANAWMVVSLLPNKSEVIEKLKSIQGIDLATCVRLEKEIRGNTELKHKELKGQVKLYNSVQKIMGLIAMDKSFDSECTTLNPYSWGDMSDQGTVLEDPARRCWKLAPSDIHSYLCLSRGKHSKIKMIMRGHEHQKRHFKHNNKLLVTTLTVGADSTYAKNWDQKDTAYLLSIAPKVKNWTKQGLQRERNHFSEELSQAYSIRSTEI